MSLVTCEGWSGSTHLSVCIYFSSFRTASMPSFLNNFSPLVILYWVSSIWLTNWSNPSELTGSLPIYCINPVWLTCPFVNFRILSICVWITASITNSASSSDWVNVCCKPVGLYLCTNCLIQCWFPSNRFVWDCVSCICRFGDIIIIG